MVNELIVLSVKHLHRRKKDMRTWRPQRQLSFGPVGPQRLILVWLICCRQDNIQMSSQGLLDLWGNLTANSSAASKEAANKREENAKNSRHKKKTRTSQSHFLPLFI